MSGISEVQRLSKTLKKEKVDRPPLICPGGMMNAAIVDIMEATGHTLPDAHHDAALMANLALDVHEQTGFENFGLPFCMTIEAEALGSTVDFGSLTSEPKIAKEKYASVSDIHFLPDGAILKEKRAGALINAISILSKNHPDIPAIATLTGPISLAASIVSPMQFLKELRKNPEGVHKALDYVTNQLISYAKEIAANGASAIAIADPTATGEILGPKLFEEYAVFYLNKLMSAISTCKLPVILHICGNVKPVQRMFPTLVQDALSVDAMVSLSELKDAYPKLTTMGNLSTYMLEFSNPSKIETAAAQLLKNNIDIIAPACGLSTSTPLENIKAFTGVVKG
ncbi:MAG: methylcobamide--CoM methyltransferase [Spirochaetaceae bacterium]|jgi:[methyl-Co(III) methanol-specific corrinoid protein]:coenzyme M methyltransferase|nr:methylcobamide--CoM methyltransferase [Spirochaetaceae bacterium]